MYNYELQLIPAVFSHTGQMHGEVKRFIKDQIRLHLTYTEGEAKSSKVGLKCISCVISRTASRNVLFSSARISMVHNLDRRTYMYDTTLINMLYGLWS